MDLTTPEGRVRAVLDLLEAEGERIPYHAARRILDALQPRPTDAQVDLPYQDQPADGELHRQLGLDPSVVIADHVVVKAATMASPLGTIPGVLHDFQHGHPDRPPTPLVQVLYLGGTPDLLRKYGVLVRDCANGAANRAQ